MKILILFVVSVCLTVLTGCAYRGAVYSEYEQLALDIRSTAASSAPVQVNFGYEQSVFAYVPKQNAGSNSTQGEAVSVISWNNIATELNPTQISTNSVLRVDAGFISGIAADVASAPSNSTVTIVAPNLTNTVSVTGSAGERISAATTAFAAKAVNDENEKIIQLIKAVDDGTGKVSQQKLDKLVKGTLIEGHVNAFYGVSTDLLTAKLMDGWRPYIPQMIANNK
jgi:hypothetical protein